MPLDSLSRRLERRLSAIESAIDQSPLLHGRVDRLSKWAYQDGFLSQAWQAWGSFSRELILQSVAGVPTATNQATGCPHSGRPERELAWIAARAAKGESIVNVRPLVAMRQEPTWGDARKIQSIVQAYGLANEQTVLSGILSAGLIVQHIQTIRNAAAHTNIETIAEVRALARFYVAAPITMPGDAILWTDPVSGDFIYRSWTARMIAAARLAVA